MTFKTRYIKDAFRTQVRLNGVEEDMPRLSHADRILMLGSCFTDEVGKRFSADMFDVVHNPFGEQYNPLSVAGVLGRILDCRRFTADDLVEDDSGVWHCWWLHSRFSSADASRLLDKANRALDDACSVLSPRPEGRIWIMVTFGTAFFYTLAGAGGDRIVVSNCHKFKPSLFECSRLDVDDIVACWMPLLDRLSETRSDIRVVFTVSPVRYLSYGPQGNTLSKSVLHLAVERLCRHAVASYFPAYEMLVDDLRDYRFYASDMVHPSADGAGYVYAALLDLLCDGATLRLADQCRSLRNRFLHRPLTDNPEGHARFMRKALEDVEKLIRCHPCLESRWHRFINNKTDDL